VAGRYGLLGVQATQGSVDQVLKVRPGLGLGGQHPLNLGVQLSVQLLPLQPLLAGAGLLLQRPFEQLDDPLPAFGVHKNSPS
jgi:hypothetical protein